MKGVDERCGWGQEPRSGPVADIPAPGAVEFSEVALAPSLVEVGLQVRLLAGVVRVHDISLRYWYATGAGGRWLA